MFEPEATYFHVTLCQGIGANFGRQNSQEAQKSEQFLPLKFLCYSLFIESVHP